MGDFPAAFDDTLCWICLADKKLDFTQRVIYSTQPIYFVCPCPNWGLTMNKTIGTSPTNMNQICDLININQPYIVWKWTKYPNSAHENHALRFTPKNVVYLYLSYIIQNNPVINYNCLGIFQMIHMG